MVKLFRRRMLRLAAVGQELASKALNRVRESGSDRAQPVPLLPAADGLEGARVMITGGTRGIGLAVAKGFAAAGARVAITGRSSSKVQAAAAEIGHDALGLTTGLNGDGSLEAAFARVEAAWGGLDILINNAGMSGPAAEVLWELPPEAFDEVMHVNATGAFRAASQAAALMQRQGTGGRIIHVSSGAVESPAQSTGAYAVSKFALEGLSRQLAADAGAAGIVSCTLRLTGIHTDMTEQALGAVRASMLPEPDTVVPAFLRLAEAPAGAVSGRSFSAPRMLDAPETELAAQSPLAASVPFTYKKYTHNGRDVVRGDPDFRIFDRAENQYGASPKVIEAVTRELQLRPASIYPDESHAGLTAALAAEYGLTPAHFAIGNGSWEVLDRFLEIFTQPGDEVIGGKPGWFGFNMLCRKRGLTVRKVPMRLRNGQPEHDLNAVAAAVTPVTRLVYLISPSNPEGAVLNRNALLAFLDKLPAGLPVLLDEAYFEYCDDPEAISAAGLLERRERPIFGLRTFSKFYALASMRVGYAYGRPEHIQLLNCAERIFSISHLSEKAAIAALQDQAHRKLVRDSTLAQRRRMEEELQAMGLSYFPSQAPFMLAELPAPLKDVVARFAQEGVILGEKAFYKSKFTMLPVSTEADTTRILDLMKCCIDELG
ncbi:SDR family NAD(P)-dependent oxidoreductase [Leisingera thetidis]|uniref:SDR family NAD(P)-dependent oxidoreductase n=1 Tax=Leisingera thetidis TaxID=2930199 RepID=UPI0021F6B87F|nr:SDR family NAD(P)-dependent oxidoreductase [Leisingera thetidis]